MSLDDLHAQLRGAVDQQLAALSERYESAIAQARTEAAAAAEQEFRARFDAAHVEWTQRAQADVAAAKQAAAQQLADATQKLADAEHRVAAAAAAVAVADERVAAAEQQLADFERSRAEMEEGVEAKARDLADQAAASARRTAELEMESEKRRANSELQAERSRAEAALTALRQQLQERPASIGAVPAAAAPAGTGVDLQALREIDRATTLSQVLDSLLRRSAASAGRAALFLINGDRLKAWKADGIRDVDAQTVESPITGRDLLARAIQTGELTTAGDESPAPPFARLGAGAAAAAIPVMIGGRPVAVLYADTTGGDPSGTWRDDVEALVRHASAIATVRTLQRTIEIVSGGTASGADDHSARRYARLLVSEIKLYHEAAVRTGRQRGDLLSRLGPEIDRARQLYEARVPASFASRTQCFQQELIQTLAEGDAALLGASH